MLISELRIDEFLGVDFVIVERRVTIHEIEVEKKSRAFDKSSVSFPVRFDATRDILERVRAVAVVSHTKAIVVPHSLGD